MPVRRPSFSRLRRLPAALPAARASEGLRAAHPAGRRPHPAGSRPPRGACPEPTARPRPARCRFRAGAPAHGPPGPCRGDASHHRPREGRCRPRPSIRTGRAAGSACRFRRVYPPRHRSRPARGHPARPHRGHNSRWGAGYGWWWRPAPSAPRRRRGGPSHRGALSFRRPPRGRRHDPFPAGRAALRGRSFRLRPLFRPQPWRPSRG